MTIRFMDEEITASEEVLRDIACTYKFASQTCAAKGYMAAAKVYADKHMSIVRAINEVMYK